MCLEIPCRTMRSLRTHKRKCPFEYDYKPSRVEIENDYLNLIAMEDIDRHEAEVFSRIEGTEDVAETESRFSVEETSDAFEPGQDFAVWDHGREDYYIKEDGTIPHL